MQFVGQRKVLYGTAVYADFLRYANAGFVFRLRQRNCQDFRIVARGLCAARVIMDSLPCDARPSIVGAAKRARYRKYGTATLAV